MSYLDDPQGTIGEQIEVHLRRMNGPILNEGDLGSCLQFLAEKIAELRQATRLLLELEQERRQFPSRIGGGWN